MAAPIGNKFGAKPRKWEGAIKRALARDDGSINRIADKVVGLALAGEQWAVKEIGDRLDGKPKQAVEATGEGGGPLTIKLIERVIVE